MIEVTYREAREGDLVFIFLSWLRHARRQGDRVFMRSRVYFANEKARIERILERAKIVVICDPARPSEVYGWLVYTKVLDLMIIHYAYVKRAYRRQGLMKSLVLKLFPQAEKEQIAITHMSDEAIPIREKYGLHYNPYLGGAR